MKILADATLPNLSILFREPLILATYKNQKELHDLLPESEVLLCRSTLKITKELLADSKIKCVASASSGIDHIDSKYLKNAGIKLFDAKGSNARSVADYVIATVAYLSKYNLIKGNKAGVIGIGEVGKLVVERLEAAGFEVICFDPLKEKLNSNYSYRSLDELTKCDLISVHANLHNIKPHASLNLISSNFINALKPNTVIINAARGGIINEQALLNNLNPLTYCTDVYTNEPNINKDLIDKATICTPHIAGHSIEAKDGAVLNLSQQLHQYYGLSIPLFNQNFNTQPQLQDKAWQDLILDLYNPIKDTKILKTTSTIAESFLIQRKSHTNRHDFSFYNASLLNDKTKLLLGFNEQP